MTTTNKKPTLASPAPHAQITSLRTNLSFLHPTSLSAFPFLSWLQTPWSPSFPPLSPAHTSAISNHFSLPTCVVATALPFCSTPSHGPDVFVVFPHSAKTQGNGKGAATNEQFLHIWHDQIVKPAFDRAWQDSTQVPISGAYMDAFVHILPAPGVYTAMDAHPFEGFRSRLRKGTPGHVSVAWPAGNPKVLDEAWSAIKGMLKGHPDLGSYQDPMLLAVQRDEIWFGEQIGARGVYEEMAKEWDGWVDADFVEAGSLRVVLEAVVGVEREVRGEVVDSGAGREFKRMAEDEEVGADAEGDDDDEDGGHRVKRRKVGEKSEEARDEGN